MLQHVIILSALTVAARWSVAPGANIRPAAPSCPRSQLTRECGELPSVCMGRNPGRIWIWCILNVTEHLWWTDIESCKALKWPYTGRNFFTFLEMLAPLRPPPATTVPLARTQALNHAQIMHESCNTWLLQLLRALRSTSQLHCMLFLWMILRRRHYW